MKSAIWNGRKAVDETSTYEYWHAKAWEGITEVVREDTDEDAIEAFQRFIRENRR